MWHIGCKVWGKDVIPRAVHGVLLATVLVSSGAALSAPEARRCPVLTPPELIAILKQRRATILHFFASWCGSCKDDLQDEVRQDAVFIATFDEQERAERAIRAIKNASAKCYFDDHDRIATALGIKSLPTSLASGELVLLKLRSQ